LKKKRMKETGKKKTMVGFVKTTQLMEGERADVGRGAF